MVTTKFFKTVCAMALTTPLLACGGDSDRLGYSKSVPDEFNVVRRPALILPPEFNLRPPSATSARPVLPTGAELARLVVLPNAPVVPLSKLEDKMLTKASRGGAYGDGIREELSNQQKGTVSENASTVEQLTKDQGAQ
jgi:hypothetical protein